jgi:hypothetical protein
LARRLTAADRRARTIRASTLAIVWLAGLGAGFVGFLSAAAKYGCAAADGGLACSTTGSVLGVLLVLSVLAVVALVTLASHHQSPRQVLTIGGAGLAALVVFLVAAWSLLASA